MEKKLLTQEEKIDKIFSVIDKISEFIKKTEILSVDEKNNFEEKTKNFKEILENFKNNDFSAEEVKNNDAMFNLIMADLKIKAYQIKCDI
ncbi:hypothetical protein [Campylobacter sp. RM16192]|uniref:hypothetical protein n=1 Tax=Campylobacter sp. RM16192 TaxID=1660080 RepID=UPI0015980D75|nr:hypothetical protein [Campylobacter sp. RM16192]QKU36250.1 hypothetical protein CDOMC_a038 [Campylobacter sp. RM16192]